MAQLTIAEAALLLNEPTGSVERLMLSAVLGFEVVDGQRVTSTEEVADMRRRYAAAERWLAELFSTSHDDVDTAPESE